LANNIHEMRTLTLAKHVLPCKEKTSSLHLQKLMTININDGHFEHL